MCCRGDDEFLPISVDDEIDKRAGFVMKRVIFFNFIRLRRDSLNRPLLGVHTTLFSSHCSWRLYCMVCFMMSCLLNANCKLCSQTKSLLGCKFKVNMFLANFLSFFPCLFKDYKRFTSGGDGGGLTKGVD
mmetsp:Transcript_25185/g.28798  ORF Transcript_25185/g.28798 Transcript_25185/m.28798 type:complete len:130 (-) Transcript_25185:46-435(-)